MSFDKFNEKEKELYIALLRSVITNRTVNSENLFAHSDTYDTASSSYTIKLFLNPLFEPEDHQRNIWSKRNGFSISITPTCGQYDPPIIAYGVPIGEEGWDFNSYWELDEEISHDHFQMSQDELSEQFKKCHFADLKWTGNLSKDFELWKSAALQCIDLFKSQIKQQLKINFKQEAS
jgi:hypothetical protein